jgi:hypothetical protein
LALVEFGRRELRGKYRTLQKPWVYALLIAAAAVKLALAGAEGLEAVSCYVAAPLGGLLAAVALAQRARKRRDTGWGLPLVAAAIGFFATGYALSVEALQAFAALGVLAGIWYIRRAESPFPNHASPFLRWRAPGAFVVLTLLGCGGLIALGQPDSDVTHAAVGVQSSGGSTANAMAGSEIHPRQLAKERATALRYKQGLSILVVVVAVAVVWVGLAHYQRRRQ